MVILVGMQSQAQRKPWDWIPDETLTLNAKLLHNPAAIQFALSS